MLFRHIDALALLLIMFVLLAFPEVSQLRLVRDVAPASFRIQNAVGHVGQIDPCPLNILTRLFR